MDKALPHYKSRKVKQHYDENKDSLIPAHLPTVSHEIMVMEEV